MDLHMVLNLEYIKLNFFVSDIQFLCFWWLRFRAISSIMELDGKGVTALFSALLEAYKKPFLLEKDKVV